MGPHTVSSVTLLCPMKVHLPWKCVAAPIPIPGSHWEWQECHSDVNGDIRSHSHQLDSSTGQEGLAAAPEDSLVPTAYVYEHS